MLPPVMSMVWRSGFFSLIADVLPYASNVSNYAVLTSDISGLI